MSVKVGYAPTAEQVTAQQARRQAQQAASLARKAKTGGRTVYDKKAGKFVSIDMGKVKAAKAERQAAAETAKAAKEAAKFGGRTIADPKTPGRFVSQSAAEVQAAAAKKAAGKNGLKDLAGKGIEQIKAFGKKAADLAKKYGKKFLEFSKTKKGKIAIAAAILTVIIGTVLHNKAENRKNDEELANRTVTGFQYLDA